MAFDDGGGGTVVTFGADGGGGTAVAFGGGGGTSVAFGADGGGGTAVAFGGGGGLGGGDQIQSHALGGPSVDEDPSERVHESNHADASKNISAIFNTELVSHSEMSALNADA